MDAEPGLVRDGGLDAMMTRPRRAPHDDVDAAIMTGSLCRDRVATIHRRFTSVSFGDAQPYVRRYGDNPHGEHFSDSTAEVYRLTGEIAVEVGWRNDVERWTHWAKLWVGGSCRDRHFCGRYCACSCGYHAADTGTALTTNHAKAAEKQRAKLTAIATKARRRARS
jgi:hypothetical protein